jgi:phosphate transport system substrate-binding protein
VALAVLLAAATASAAGPAQPLVFAGGGSGIPIVRLLADAFARTRPDVHIEVPPSIGTGGGIRAAAEGAITVGLIGRTLRDSERALGLSVLTYAQTAIVFGTHRTVGEHNITTTALLDIYRGTKTRWDDGHEIVVLTREPGEATIEVLEQRIPGFAAVYAESYQAKRWTVLRSEPAMNEALSRTPHAIGVTDLGAITAEQWSIKVLSFNGIYPLAPHVLSGRYPLVKTLSFVYRRDALPAGARAFFEFVRSKEGTRILKASGYLPGD